MKFSARDFAQFIRAANLFSTIRIRALKIIVVNKNNDTN